MSREPHHSCKDTVNFGWHSCGPAIEACCSDEYGFFWVGNGEYESMVAFCPFCGEKARRAPVSQEEWEKIMEVMTNTTLESLFSDLLVECKEHGMVNNPYGSFADALRNLAAEITEIGGRRYGVDGKMFEWSKWLQAKSIRLDAVVIRAGGMVNDD